MTPDPAAQSSVPTEWTDCFPRPGFPRPDEKALGGIGSIARDALGAIAWDPNEHPRDYRGQFIDKGSTVILPGGGTGTVIGNRAGGTVIVETDDGDVAVDGADLKTRDQLYESSPFTPDDARRLRAIHERGGLATPEEVEERRAIEQRLRDEGRVHAESPDGEVWSYLTGRIGGVSFVSRVTDEGLDMSAEQKQSVADVINSVLPEFSDEPVAVYYADIPGVQAEASRGSVSVSTEFWEDRYHSREWIDKQAGLYATEERGITGDESRRRALIHEIGHVIDLRHAVAKDATSQQVRGYASEPLEGDALPGPYRDGPPLPRWQVTPLVAPDGTDRSYYATENEHEFIAEAFLDAYVHGDAAAPESKVIMGFLRQGPRSIPAWEPPARQPRRRRPTPASAVSYDEDPLDARVQSRSPDGGGSIIKITNEGRGKWSWFVYVGRTPQKFDVTASGTETTQAKAKAAAEAAYARGRDRLLSEGGVIQ